MPGFVYVECSRDIHALAGTLAANGSSLAFIDDAGHKPIGFQIPVTFPNPYAFQLDFECDFNFVNTIQATPDETYAAFGIQAGASVYLDKAIFNVYAPLSLSYAGFNGIAAPALWNGYIQNELIPGGVTIHHPDSNHYPVVTPILNAQSAGCSLSTQYAKDYTTVFAWDNMGGFVSCNGSVFAQSLSNNIDAPTFACVNGNLVVTHADIGSSSYGVTLTQFGQFTPRLLNMCPTGFTVGFRNAAGADVSAMTAGIGFIYSRNTKVRRNMDGVQFTLSREMAAVPIEALRNVPNGNFWISGLMEF